MEWQPIETYDKLKKKPKRAVFFVKAFTNEGRSYASLAATVVTERYFGQRTVTHWLPLPNDPEF